MGAIWSLVSKMIEETDNVRSAWVCLGRGGLWMWVGWSWLYGGSGGGDEALEEFYFVEGCFCVSWCGFDDFEGDMSAHPDRFGG